MSMRGFRWQLIALVLSLLIFATVVVFKFFNTPQEAFAPTPILASATPEPLPTSTPIPPSPIPTQIPDTSDNEAQSTNTIPTYREALVGQVQRLNPLFATGNSPESDITSLIFEGLVAINQYGEPVADLAESWVVSRDGYEYVFQLRQDILWQDGISFTADDVIFTLSLLSSPDFPGLDAQQQFWQSVEMQKLGSHLIRFRLAQPLASFPTLLTIGILPEHALRGTTASELASHPFNLSPIGTGAYQLETLRSSDGQIINAIDLRVAPTYRQRPEGQTGFAIERIQFILFSSYDAAVLGLANGVVDGLATRAMSEREALTDISSINVYTEVEPTLGVLIYNWDEGDERFFSDPRVRTGLQLGLDKRNPVERNLLNQAVIADSPLLDSSWAYDPALNWTVPNPPQALDLIQTAIQRSAPDEESTEEPVDFNFNILVVDTPAIKNLAQEIATQWSQYGITIAVEAVGAEAYQQRLDDADFDIAIVELPLGADPDVFAYWHIGQYPDGLNYGGTADDRISELLERARQETNGLNRVDLYHQFQQLFLNRAVAIPLYYPLYTYAINESVTGVQLGFIDEPASRFRNIQDWEIVE